MQHVFCSSSPVFPEGTVRQVFGKILMGLALLWLPVMAAAQSTTVVISQVYGGGGNAGAPYKNDFVELHNISSGPVSVDGWSVQYNSAASTTGNWQVTVLPDVSIPSGGYLLVSQAAGAGDVPALPDPDVEGSISMAAGSGKVALVASATPLAVANPAGTVVDLVGYGTATGYEGAGPVAALSNSTAALRNDQGSTDTDNNLADFTVGAPVPRNSETPPYLPSADLLVSSLDPENGADEVPHDSDLTVMFNRAVEPVEGGTVTLFRAGQPDPEVTWDVEDWSTVDIVGGVVKLYLPAAFTPSTDYYVLISPGAFKAVDGALFDGVSSPSVWAFRSAPPDIVGPVPTEYTPAAGSVGVAPYGVPFSPKIRFDEGISLSPAGGTISLHDGSDVLLETLDEVDMVVGGLGDELYLFFDTQLSPDQVYKVKVSANAVEDLLGNPNLAFEWSFTSEAEPEAAPLYAADSYTENFTIFGPVSDEGAEPALPLGWSLKGLVTTFNETVTQRAWGQGVNSGLRGLVGENVLGYQHTGSTVNDLTSPNLEKILTLRNETGEPIQNLVIEYTGKVERFDDETASRSPAYEVTVAGVSVPALGYGTGVSASDQRLVAPVTGLNIAPGAIFQIIWSSNRGGGSGGSKQIGLTDVSIGLGTGAFPPTVAGLASQLGKLEDVSAVMKVNVSADNGSAVTQRGFVYSPLTENPDPVIGGAGVIQVTNPETGTGEFEEEFTGLSPATAYVVKGFATNGNGTSYTLPLTVTTLPSPPVFTGVYEQPFDHYDGVWPVGWSAVSGGGVQVFNSTLDWSGAATNGGFYGNAGNPGLLGYLHTAASVDLNVKLRLTNGTGAPLTELFVKYLGRTGNVLGTRLPDWKVSINGVEYPVLAYSTAAGVDEEIKGVITGLSIAPGERFTIEWFSTRGEGSGNSRKIGLGEVVVALEEPEPGETEGFAAWLEVNAPGQTIGDDHDGDGVPNGVEYFFGLTGSGFTATPGIVNGKITWPDAGVTDVAYRVEVSTTLEAGSWVTVPEESLDLTVAGEISYVVPPSTPEEPRRFVRFVVTELEE